MTFENFGFVTLRIVAAVRCCTGAPNNMFSLGVGQPTCCCHTASHTLTSLEGNLTGNKSTQWIGRVVVLLMSTDVVLVQ